MTDRPRVLYLSGWPIGARGEGAVSFVYEQIEALAGAVEATFIEPRFAHVARWPGRVAARAEFEPITDLWPRDVRALTAWMPRWPTRLTGRHHLEDLRRASRGLARRLRRRFGRFDLVHAHVVLPAGLVGAGIADELNIPLLLQEHSGPFEMHLGTEETIAAVRFVLRRARIIAAVGHDLASRIRAVATADIDVRVTPNLVRSDLFVPHGQRKGRSGIMLVAVASLVPVKSLCTFVSAVARLRDEGVDVHARIVGDGELRGALEHQIAELSLDDRVQLMGALPRRAVADVLASSDIYVCSSLTETFGLAPAEALATGRPVVTTRCGGPEEFVDESCGAVVPRGDVVALREAICSVAEHLATFEPEKLHRRIEARFGPAAFRARVLALYSEMLGR